MGIGISVNFGDDEYDFIPDESIASSCQRCVFKGCPTRCSSLKESFQCGDLGYFVKHQTSAVDIKKIEVLRKSLDYLVKEIKRLEEGDD